MNNSVRVCDSVTNCSFCDKKVLVKNSFSGIIQRMLGYADIPLKIIKSIVIESLSAEYYIIYCMSPLISTKLNFKSK